MRSPATRHAWERSAASASVTTRPARAGRLTRLPRQRQARGRHHRVACARHVHRLLAAVSLEARPGLALPEREPVAAARDDQVLRAHNAHQTRSYARQIALVAGFDPRSGCRLALV